MGGASSHSELKREAIRREGYVLKLKHSSSQRYLFKLQDRELTYSKAEGSPVNSTQMRKTIKLDREFKVISSDFDALELKLNVTVQSGEHKCWWLRWNDRADFEYWSTILMFAIRPYWDDPKKSRICKVCAVSFGFARRQHHCRKCGGAVCNRHSTKRFKIPEMGYECPVRICDTCYMRMGSEDALPRFSSLPIKNFQATSLSSIIFAPQQEAPTV